MMNFNFNKWNTILGWTTFAIALITFSLTVEPTMSFWDCGEYISTAAKLEVGHPPGAPLFQILGAFFAPVFDRLFQLRLRLLVRIRHFGGLGIGEHE